MLFDIYDNLNLVLYALSNTLFFLKYSLALNELTMVKATTINLAM